MTQEERLLLTDLCGRLPYGVKIELTWWVMGEGTYINTTLEPDHIEQLLNNEDGDTEIKPYLFPLENMTEEQWNNAPRVNLTKFTFESLKCGCFTLASYTCEHDLHDLVEFINCAYRRIENNERD